MHPRHLPTVLMLLLALGCDDGAGPLDAGSTDGGETPMDAWVPPGVDGGPVTGGDGGAPTTDAGPGAAYDCASPAPAWLMCEDFEAGGGDFDTWFTQSDFVTAVGRDDRGRIDLSTDGPHDGTYAVYMGAAADSGYRGADLAWMDCVGEQATNCDLEHHERLYFRAFVRFADDHRYVHHFMNVGGRDRFWPYGTAGCLPNGTSQMGTTVDHRRDSHESFFYTYHLDMSCDTSCDRYADVDRICADCADKGFPTCDAQPQCCWGNHFEPETPVALPTGRWFCFEMMMDPNTPGASDGEMAYWIDGELAHREDGMRWRTTSDLGMNYARVQHYIASGDDDQPNRVWFDDVVVSTEPIGCADY